MNTLRFNITPVGGDGLSESQSEKIMEHVHKLLEHIGMFIVTAEMGFQGDSPESFKSKFDLSSEPKDRTGGDSVLETALVWLENTLDVANTDIIERWLSGTYTDPRYKIAIAKELAALCDVLGDNKLSYGRGKSLKEFRSANIEYFRKVSETDMKSFTSTLAGVIERSTDARGRKGYFLNTGTESYRIDLWREFNRKDAEYFLDKGPCLISGMSVHNSEGKIIDVRNFCSASEFPGIEFSRIITPDRDIMLLNSLMADIKFDKSASKWTLSNDILGMSVSGKNWNRVVAEFHDYFIFLWETYVEEVKDNLSEEEVEIREFLLSMVPF